MLDKDRRTALAMMAGVGMAGVGMAAGSLALAGCAKAKGESDEGGDVTANEDLMREHGVLRRILVVYREISPKLVADPRAIDAKALGDAAALFRRFGEQYHEQLLEEQHIFPIVRKAGGEAAGLVDTLVVQHRRGRAISDYIIDRTRAGSIAAGDADPLAKAMIAFCRMYEAHTAREDTILFPAFKKAVGEKGYGELGEQFEEIERKTFGGDGFDMALDKIAAVERTFGLADLGLFTAPVPGAADGGTARPA